MSTGTEIDAEALIDRFTLKALVESCLVLEEGVAGPFETLEEITLEDGLHPVQLGEL